MADCAAETWGGPLLDEEDSRWLTLNQALGMGGHLRAVCETAHCTLSSTLDPAHWLAIGLGELGLESLGDRMRCPCGARRARFQVWPGLAPLERAPGPYIFH